ncbi:MAG TPA: hypothetical protein P5119_04780 [Candidatus Aminicenantes bacterium]|nr:hypothetical protein [Candidatus Aminicenantes bacterium]HRY64641.1 hypothetical protein [Candidatus Aminicenantes bacterium]HRZ71554.1 hypothetical protein [Candidatus Aminicenantes bacterium]
MRKSALVLAIALAAPLVLTIAARAQAPAKPAIVGTWTGTANGGGGELLEITLVLAESEAGFSGKISDASGFVPETELRQIVLKDNKLTFELELESGSGPMLLKIELAVEAGTMKGDWFDPDGNSGSIELTLKK